MTAASREASIAAISKELAILNEVDEIDEQLAAARRERDTEAVRQQAEIQQLTVEGIRLAEREQQQSYDRAGTNTTQHYARMTALAEERNQLRAEVQDLETRLAATQARVSETRTADYVQLAQGIIIGLGVGIVLVWVLMRRGNDENIIEE